MFKHEVYGSKKYVEMHAKLLKKAMTQHKIVKYHDVLLNSFISFPKCTKCVHFGSNQTGNKGAN